MYCICIVCNKNPQYRLLYDFVKYFLLGKLWENFILFFFCVSSEHFSRLCPLPYISTPSPYFPKPATAEKCRLKTIWHKFVVYILFYFEKGDISWQFEYQSGARKRVTFRNQAPREQPLQFGTNYVSSNLKVDL